MKIRYLHLSDIHLGYSEKRDSKWAAHAFNQDIDILLEQLTREHSIAAEQKGRARDWNKLGVVERDM